VQVDPQGAPETGKESDSAVPSTSGAQTLNASIKENSNNQQLVPSKKQKRDKTMCLLEKSEA
jgi:hypothetical protein